MSYLAVLLLVASASTMEYHKVPSFNGTFKLMSDKEITAILDEEEANPRYNAYADIVFHLYTNSNPNESQVIEIDDNTSLLASNFDLSVPTVVLVHGWFMDHTVFFVQEAKDEYLKKGQYNVIGVDWSSGANTIFYPLAKSRVGSSGTVVGKFIEFLESNKDLNINDVIAVGFSLGAHVIGNAGKHLNGRLPVIFGLDPAGPLFRPMDSDRLLPSDARHVEVIHTNTWGYGYLAPCGDADFYPNGGGTQPGCILPSCSHNRALYYFIESINGDVQFIGRKCKKFISTRQEICQFEFGATKVMGGEPHTPGNGVYHVAVNHMPPYALRKQ